MRTWNLRLNLDELNALALSAFSDQERLDLFHGLLLGCNAGTLPEHCSNIVRSSFEVGLSWRHEAEGFKDRKSKAGKLSAGTRKEKFGTAQPSNTARTLLERCPNQSTIHNPLNENHTNQKEEPPTPLETAPPSAKAEKPLRVKKLKTTELKPESVEAFQAAWETIPASVVRWDTTVRREVEEAVAKGSRAEAERNFQAIVDAKIATPRTLYVALYAYITEGEGPKKGFVQHCATFYGPKKRTYLEWLDRARAIEAERYGVPA